MKTKYEKVIIEKEHYDFNINRLTNQIWKLIPMKEHEEDWQAQLDTVLLEITGLAELFCSHTKFIVLLSKLEGLKTGDWTFDLYRKTVFESITLLREIQL